MVQRKIDDLSKERLHDNNVQEQCIVTTPHLDLQCRMECDKLTVKMDLKKHLKSGLHRKNTGKNTEIPRQDFHFKIRKFGYHCRQAIWTHKWLGGTGVCNKRKEPVSDPIFYVYFPLFSVFLELKLHRKVFAQLQLCLKVF